MTPDAISAEWRAEMRALVEAATPGPWCGREHSHSTGYVHHVSAATDGLIADTDCDFPEAKPNAAFIAASREAVPALLDAYEALLAATQKAVGVGFNEDCIFCGFKDRFLKAALGQEARDE